MRSVEMLYGHTTTFIFECCRRNTQGHDTAPTGLAKVAVTKKTCCGKEICGFCSVGVCTSRSDVLSVWTIGVTQIVKQNQPW